MQKITYYILSNAIFKLTNSKYSDGRLFIIEKQSAFGFGIRKCKNFYIYGKIGWSGEGLDDFGFDSAFNMSENIDDVIYSFIKYYVENIDECLIWKNEKNKQRYLNFTDNELFGFFKKSELAIKMDLENNI